MSWTPLMRVPRAPLAPVLICTLACIIAAAPVAALAAAPRAPTGAAVVAAAGSVLAATPAAAPQGVTGSAPPQEAPLARLEPHVFEASSGDTVHAELGRFRVPLNRRRGGADSLELAFVRFPAVVDDAGPPLVYLAGGPGGSGIAAARFSRFPLFMAFRRFGDVIAFDQRGTGMSGGPAPEECDLTVQYPVGRPLYAAHHRKLTLDAARKCAEMWRREGVDLSAYNTRESADDVAALASALGVERLRLWGISYGTHLGLTVIRRHPELVERAILAGVEGPDHTVKLPSYWTGQLEALERLVAAERAAGGVGGAGTTGPGFDDLRATMDSVLRALEREPARAEMISADLRDTVPHLVTRYEVELATIDALRDPETMVRVPYLYRRMVLGDFSSVAGPEPTLGGFEAMSESMDAASGISDERLFRFLREDETHLLGGGDDLTNAYMADALGVPDLGDGFRASVRSEIPALLISGTLDGRTPVGNAEEVLRGFPNARHLIVENAGHSDDLFLSSPEILGVMEAFLAGREIPITRIRVEPPVVASGRLPPSLPEELVDGIAGAYRRSEGDVWRVIRNGTVRSLDATGAETGRRDALMIRIRGNGYPFAPRPDTSFHIPFFGPGLEFRFPRDGSGGVAGMELVRSAGDTTRLVPVVWESVGFLDSRRWYVVGPFHDGDRPRGEGRVGSICDRSFAPETDAVEGSRDPETDAAGARPDIRREGTLGIDSVYSTARGDLRWREAEGDDGFVNFEETLGGALVGGVGYAYLIVTSDTRREAQLRVGTDDDARIFLNGERVHAFDGAREAWEEQDRVPVTFPAGRSLLLVKVCNRDSDWRFNLRITDPSGRSLVEEEETSRGRVRLRPGR